MPKTYKSSAAEEAEAKRISEAIRKKREARGAKVPPRSTPPSKNVGWLKTIENLGSGLAAAAKENIKKAPSRKREAIEAMSRGDKPGMLDNRSAKEIMEESNKKNYPGQSVYKKRGK